MALSDSAALQEAIKHLFPGIIVEQLVPTPSGQRLVYFCKFSRDTVVPSQQDWDRWGPAVLKISEDVHPTIIARLEKEIEILNSLNSPYYPKLYYYDVFSEDPVTEARFVHRLFVTIEERINGPALSSCRDRYAEEMTVARLLLQLVDGLRLLWEHPQKIVHRDLKPDNILIRLDGHPVIIDLGIVREEGSQGVTLSQWHIGPCTPAYASPEQVRNDKKFITFKSDFFALGTLAYELLTQGNPFKHSPHEPHEVVIDRVLKSEPTPLKKLGKASERFSDVIARLMSKEPYQRYRTVDSLRAELVHFVEGT